MTCPNCGWTGVVAIPELGMLVEAVARRYGTDRCAVIGKDRSKYVAEARHVAQYLARRLIKMSYPELGRAFGNRDHSTVLSACRRVAWALATSDPDPLQQRIRDSVDSVLLAIKPKDPLRRATVEGAPEETTNTRVA